MRTGNDAAYDGHSRV